MGFNTLTVLKAIGSTEASMFNEFCSQLGDNCPEKGDKTAWSTLFRIIDQAEERNLVEVNRVGRNIESLILTESGADYVRANPDRGW